MCGICGFVDFRNMRSEEALTRIASDMASSIYHRGPDDGASWCDADAGIAMAFRRLAIVDLSPSGRQPMQSASGRSVICFNGEIYNAPDLRKSLETRVETWRGHSDTEVLIEAIEHWGIENALPKLIGMFAFAYWDRSKRRLWLARDPLGIKPLYWSRLGSTILFASELRALILHPLFKKDIDREATSAYLSHNFFPAPQTVFKNVHQLPPGHVLCLEGEAEPRITPFWSLSEAIEQAQRDPFVGNEHAAADALDALLCDSVKRQMAADVPLGAFLSGGYDSSTVVALMQKQSTMPVRTFSIGFEEDGFDEATHARKVAKHLGTLHTEFYVSPKEAYDVIPHLADIYDEPFGDSSQIPTYLVSALARDHVTVALSGDGGDEVFAGYNRYLHANAFNRMAHCLPSQVRRATAAAIETVAPTGWDRLGQVVPARHRPRHLGENLHKLAGLLKDDSEEYYKNIMLRWRGADLIRGVQEPPTAISDPTVASQLPNQIERMQYKDTVCYLPDDILTKVDRASMAVSLEVRVPLLDHRIVEFAWSLPLPLKIDHRSTKKILRKVLYRYVPPELVDRPKSGFSIPIGNWLRGPLRTWAEDLFNSRTFLEGDLIDPRPVQAIWKEHLATKRNWQHALWSVLMLLSWHARWMKPEPLRSRKEGLGDVHTFSP